MKANDWAALHPTQARLAPLALLSRQEVRRFLPRAPGGKFMQLRRVCTHGQAR